jgi:cell wall-associated NlpC family hydrolase
MPRLFPAPVVPAGVDAVEWKRDRIVEVAKHYQGLMYKRADGNRGHFPARGCGLDCSNFVAWVYNYGLGIKLNSHVDAMANQAGRKLGADEPLKKGDLIFLDTDPRHVVIYIDENHVIDSTSLRPEGVQVRDLRELKNKKRYTPNATNSKFMYVRRVIE